MDPQTVIQLGDASGFGFFGGIGSGRPGRAVIFEGHVGGIKVG